jgi:hypothetical protein
MKPYPLEVNSLHDLDSGQTTLYYTKGHHPLTEFAKEVKREFEVDVDPTDIHHTYMRWEMYAGPDGPCHVGELHTKPGRGIFPVTYADAWQLKMPQTSEASQ